MTHQVQFLRRVGLDGFLEIAMSRSSKVAFLDHSKILFIPVVGSILYKLQYFLYSNDLIKVIKISRKPNPIKDKLLKLISEKAKFTVCQSYKLGTSLSNVENEIIADFKIPYDLKKQLTQTIFDVCWSLVFSKKVTPETKKELGDFIQKSFPETKIILIPFHDEPGVICDYVFQTAKELARLGNLIFLVSFSEPKSIFKLLLEDSDQIKILENKFKNFDNISIYQPFSLLPIRLNKFGLVNKVNWIFSNLHLTILVRKLNRPTLWCLDWKDSTVLRLNKKLALGIYDCVDYWTSLDKNYAETMGQSEEYLIKNSNFFFVNSEALFNVKKRFRIADAVVPQGFDVESFTSNKQPRTKSPRLSRSLNKLLGKTENDELITYQKILSNIPRPAVGFVGNLTFRIDYELLDEIISLLPHVSFVFTESVKHTPEDKIRGELSSKINKIKKYKNVFFVPKTQNRLVVKEIINTFDIGIIPYDISLDFNKYSYPMKLFEYFFLGKPVVSTPIEELKRFPKFVKIGNTNEEWEKHIKNLLSKPWPKENQKQQRKLSEENSWRKKVAKITNVMQEVDS